MMMSQQRLIEEYESLRHQSRERATHRVTLTLRAVMEGGMVGFMRCCDVLLRNSATQADTVRPVRRTACTQTSRPSVELTHALAEMVLTIVSQELVQ